MANNLSTVDSAIVLIYIAGIFAVGIYAWIQQRKQPSNQAAESYFMASRDVLWLAVGATLFSSNIGAEHFVGLSGSAAKSGIAVGAWEWTAPFLLLIQGYFVAPIFISSNIVTTPQYLELRFNRVVRVYNAFITLVIYIFVVISSTLYAGAVILHTIVGWSLYVSSIALIMATGVYVVLGGLRAVVYTENVQTVILIVGGFLLMGYSLSAVGGLSGIYAKSDQFPEHYRAQYMHLFRPYDDADWPWIGITFGIIAQSYYYWCGNHLLIQRVLSSKTALHAKYGAITASILKILPVWMMCIPGICAVLLYPEDFADGTHEQYDRAYPLMVIRILPKGLIGLVLAAMLSALMSSLAAVYNSAAAIITHDIYKLMFPRSTVSDSRLVLIGRVSACAFVCISLLWLPMIQNGKHELFAYTQAVSAYIQTPLSVIYFFATFWDRANATGAYCAIAFGFVSGFIRFILSFVVTEYCDHTIFCSANFLYFGMFMLLTCSLLMIGASLLTSKPSEDKIRGLTYWSIRRIKKQKRFQQKSPLHQDINGAIGTIELQQVEAKRDMHDHQQPKQSKGFVELDDDLDERTQSVELGKGSDSCQSLPPRPVDDVIVVAHTRCCSKFMHLDGDENNKQWKYLANVLAIASMMGLLACWIAFF